MHTRCALVTVVQTCALPILARLSPSFAWAGGGGSSNEAGFGNQRQVVGGVQSHSVIHHPRVGDLPLRREIDPVQAQLRPAHRIGRHAHAGREARGEKRSEEHTSELQSLMRISYAVFCLKKKTSKQK